MGQVLSANGFQRIFIVDCTSGMSLSTLKEKASDGHKSVAVYPALSRVRSENNSSGRLVMQMVQFLSILNTVEGRRYDVCFCKNLSRVTFGESSSLKLIGVGHSFEVVWSVFIFPMVLSRS